MELRETSYITVPAFARTQYGLSGNSLLTYAIIHGFSQDGATWFTGSAAYIAEWCGCDKKTTLRILAKLCEDGLLVKRKRVENGVTFCDYMAVTPSQSRQKAVSSPKPAECGQAVKEDAAQKTASVAEPSEFATQSMRIYNACNGTDVKPSANVLGMLDSLKLQGVTLAQVSAVCRLKADQVAAGKDGTEWNTPARIFGSRFADYLAECQQNLRKKAKSAKKRRNNATCPHCGGRGWWSPQLGRYTCGACCETFGADEQPEQPVEQPSELPANSVDAVAW